jgi:hypothetical protein
MHPGTRNKPEREKPIQSKTHTPTDDNIIPPTDSPNVDTLMYIGSKPNTIDEKKNEPLKIEHLSLIVPTYNRDVGPLIHAGIDPTRPPYHRQPDDNKDKHIPTDLYIKPLLYIGTKRISFLERVGADEVSKQLSSIDYQSLLYTIKPFKKKIKPPKVEIFTF